MFCGSNEKCKKSMKIKYHTRLIGKDTILIIFDYFTFVQLARDRTCRYFVESATGSLDNNQRSVVAKYLQRS